MRPSPFPVPRRPLGAQLATTLTLALFGMLPACGSCDEEDGQRVPFKADNGDDTDDPGSSAGEGGTETEFTPRSGRKLPKGTRKVAVQGAPLRVSEGVLRGLLALDLDDDGDRDAVVAYGPPEGGLALRFARRDGSQFGELEELTPLVEPGKDCKLGTVQLRTISRRTAIVALQRKCTQGPERAMAVLSLEARPRVLERITLLPPQGRVPGDVAVALRTEDRDDDGYEDVVLKVSVTPPDFDTPASVELPWLDRPGGLSRDPEQPEKTLTELANEAAKALEGDPSAALEHARRALALHGVLCREGEGPRIRFGGGAGLQCGASAGAGRAAAVAAAALVQQGKLFAALDAAQRLDQREGYKVSDADRQRLKRAWNEAPTPQSLSWRRVAKHEVPRKPDVRLPAIALLDTQTLLLRGDSPKRVDLQTEETTPANKQRGSVLVRDPSNELAVVDLARDCNGYRLTIARTSDIHAGIVAGRPVSEPLLVEHAPPAGAGCPDDALPKSLQQDDGGWHILGWAPQGVVAVRHDDVRVVPLDVEGKPTGETNVLDTATPPPAPLPHGAATPDGSAYVEPFRYGVLLRRMGPDASTLLLRPDGWSDAKGQAHDATIAPNGRRVAVMRGSNVWLIEGIGGS